ncbi:cupin domain-containing protein [Phytoactinopolyspora halotolerans]|uniref:Cupin domain-containing protein n=1 Tax=Phytoactinopolyspora halotolerans TaxID=1981512 RepID=A0A6L9S8U8_9ACTN|nr:cupin domain-containing protein [Phytoactinopolyspora halotolerans]NEE01489.1 cupin domain-containing protein [Phytoactinopolyspora halotolerans]
MPPAFPGGTSVSRLSVYRDACADGLAGGTPHLHTASTEGYVVTGGRGALQTIDMSGFREIELAAGSTVWFTPGTIHRAVNHDDLEAVVVMQNAGLPEAGDAVMTFPPEVVEDPARYREAATLPSDVSDDEVAAAMRRRRDLAVEGFRRIRQAIDGGDSGPLQRLYAAAAALVRPAVPGWRKIWDGTVAHTTQVTSEVLDALERGEAGHLHDAVVLESPQSTTRRWGMCGRLHTHDVAQPHVHSSPPDGR